jgi:hypothetical protein
MNGKVRDEGDRTAEPDFRHVPDRRFPRKRPEVVIDEGENGGPASIAHRADQTREKCHPIFVEQRLEVAIPLFA